MEELQQELTELYDLLECGEYRLNVEATHKRIAEIKAIIEDLEEEEDD